MDMSSLETERLVLRQWREEDLEPFADLNADAQVREFFLKTLSVAESNDMFAKYSAALAERGWGMWALEEKHSSHFIGVVGLQVPGVDMPVSPCVEIAWRLAVPYWGKGYATEAARCVLDFAFSALKLAEVVAFTTLQNRRSQAVMEKLGMLREAQDFMHPAVPAGHPLQAHCLYKISRPNGVQQ